MTTGPLPMISTDGLAGFTAQPLGHEAIEDRQRVERTGRALRVVLDGLDRLGRVAQPLDRAVVEVALADDEAAVWRQRLADDLDLVVLRRHLDAAVTRGP